MPSLLIRLSETFRIFSLISLTSFGGTGANILYLKKVFVSRLEWVDEQTYQDLFALGSALPGPSYIQLGFSIALLRGGLLCGFLAVALLTLPGALIMFGLAMAVRKFPSDLPDVVPPLFSGLNSAAVGLIALAGYSLSKSSGKTALTKLIVFLTGAIPTLYTSLWLFPTIIAGSGLLTWTSDEVLRKFPRAGRRARNWDGSPPSSGDGAVPQVLPEQIQPEEIRSTPREIEAASAKSQPGSTVLRRSMSRLSPALEQTHTQPAAIVAIQPLHFGLSVMAGLTILIVSVASLTILLAVRYSIASPIPLSLLANFVIAGTIIFGGGPVVIPLLKGYTVDPGWVDSREFLLGFAMLQALPGPQFNLAVYLGALAMPHNPVLGGIIGYTGLYTPGILLKLAILPLYSHFRSYRAVRSIVEGLNAGGTGLIWGALYRLWSVGFVLNGTEMPTTTKILDQDAWWVVVAAASFLGCEWFNVWPPFAIVGGGVAGVSWWGVTQRR